MLKYLFFVLDLVVEVCVLIQFDMIATAPPYLLYKTLSSMSAHLNVSQLLVQVAQLTWAGGRHTAGCWMEEGQQQVREDPWNRETGTFL